VAVAVAVAAERRAEEAQIEQLLETSQGVLSAAQLDAAAAQAALRALKDHRLGDADARLVMARARLLLALGRFQQAWDAVAPLALAFEPAPAERLVAARILQRLHGLRGDAMLAGQSADLAEGHYEVTGDVESAFLAWQSARRAGRAEQAAALAEKLQARHGDTPEGRLVAAINREDTSMEVLLQLEIDFGSRRRPLDAALTPEEIDAAVAFMLLRDGSEDKVGEAITRLERVLLSYPADPDVRAMLAFALHQSGDRTRRDLHLDWLLDNAPDDARHADWRQMREQPAAGR
jgi:hypothetical protein